MTPRGDVVGHRRCLNPEDHDLNLNRRGNLKSCMCIKPLLLTGNYTHHLFVIIILNHLFFVTEVEERVELLIARRTELAKGLVR